MASPGADGEPPPPPPEPPPESAAADEEKEGEDSEPEYTVEKIIRQKGSGAKKMYLVKWLGYEDEAENTWEPASNLHPKLVEEYEAEKGAASSSADGGGKAKKRPRGNAPKDEHGRDMEWDAEVGCPQPPPAPPPRSPRTLARVRVPLAHVDPRVRPPRGCGADGLGRGPAERDGAEADADDQGESGAPQAARAR